MPSGRGRPSRKPAYHHGDLRPALIAASVRLIEAEGLMRLSLREAARRAGVTHSAPAHHFGDKDGLLDAIAEEGFARLRDQMRAARVLREDPRERLAVIGMAYIRFAGENPGFFQVMFRPGRARTPLRGPSARQAYQVLVETVDELRTAARSRHSLDGLVLLAWASVHGFASLWMDGALVRERGEEMDGRLSAGMVELLSRLYAGGAPARRRP